MATIRKRVTGQLDKYGQEIISYQVRWREPVHGEVTELRRKDIGQGCEVISVGRAVTHRDGKCIIDTPKSGKPCMVVVPPHIRTDIKTHLAEHTSPDPDALLFPPIRGGCHLSDKV